MSWGEDERTDYQRDWRETKKCYYCSELKNSKLTTLDKGTYPGEGEETVDKRIVCYKCKNRVCFFCGEYKEREHIAEKKKNGHIICYDCIIKKIPASVVQYIESELMKKIHSQLFKIRL